MLTLNPSVLYEFLFQGPWPVLTEAATSLAKRRRAWTPSAAILTTATLLITSAFDRGNKHHDWCRTEASPHSTTGFGRGDTGAGELT